MTDEPEIIPHLAAEARLLELAGPVPSGVTLEELRRYFRHVMAYPGPLAPIRTANIREIVAARIIALSSGSSDWARARQIMQRHRYRNPDAELARLYRIGLEVVHFAATDPVEAELSAPVGKAVERPRKKPGRPPKVKTAPPPG